MANREIGKSVVYAAITVGTVIFAYMSNQRWLELFWRFKALKLSSVFLKDYYAAKQEALFTLLGLYLIILAVSNLDAFLNRHSGVAEK